MYVKFDIEFQLNILKKYCNEYSINKENVDIYVNQQLVKSASNESVVVNILIFYNIDLDVAWIVLDDTCVSVVKPSNELWHDFELNEVDILKEYTNYEED